MAHPSGDPQSWHRYFAIECNNRAWDLAVRARTPEEDRELLNAAHASALHWQAAGTELNHMRARMLLAEVHALLGLGPSALDYAWEACDYFLSRETPDWEVAFMHAIYAHAAAVAGDEEGHRSAYAEAQRAIAAIADDQDRAIVLQTFNQVPAPERRRPFQR
jgi:hypothetical protein